MANVIPSHHALKCLLTCSSAGFRQNRRLGRLRPAKQSGNQSRHAHNHSVFTFSLPRSRNCRNPIPSFSIANGVSASHVRHRYLPRPDSDARGESISSRKAPWAYLRARMRITPEQVSPSLWRAVSFSTVEPLLPVGAAVRLTL